MNEPTYNVFISVGSYSDKYLTDPFLINKIEQEVKKCGAHPLVHRVDELSEATIQSSIEELGKSCEYWCILTPSIYERLPYVWMETGVIRYRNNIEDDKIIIRAIEIYDYSYSKLPVILRPDIQYKDENEQEFFFMELKKRVEDWIENHRHKIFISYSHHDKGIAFKLKNSLEQAGFQVLIDTELIESGSNIQDYIIKSINATDVTLSIVSRKSLMSLWVAQETFTTFSKEKVGGGNQLIACFSDKELMEELQSDLGNVQSNLGSELKEEIDYLETNIQNIMKNDQNITTLARRMERLKELQNGLDSILNHLNECKYENALDEDNFESSVQNIVHVINCSDQASSIPFLQINHK